jgi:anti-sigma B factor antagonist
MTMVPPAALTSRITLDHGDAVVAVSGELDLSTAGELGRALIDLVGRHPHALTVDLAGLRFIDSTGLTLLVRTRTQLAEDGATLWLSSPTPPVRRVLEIVGLDTLLVA